MVSPSGISLRTESEISLLPEPWRPRLRPQDHAAVSVAKAGNAQRIERVRLAHREPVDSLDLELTEAAVLHQTGERVDPARRRSRAREPQHGSGATPEERAGLTTPGHGRRL